MVLNQDGTMLTHHCHNHRKRFGLMDADIAESFAIMGANCILNKEAHLFTRTLVLFARSQILHAYGTFHEPHTQRKTWVQMKKKSDFNQTVENWTKEEIDKLATRFRHLTKVN